MRARQFNGRTVISRATQTRPQKGISRQTQTQPQTQHGDQPDDSDSESPNLNNLNPRPGYYTRLAIEELVKQDVALGIRAELLQKKAGRSGAAADAHRREILEIIQQRRMHQDTLTSMRRCLASIPLDSISDCDDDYDNHIDIGVGGIIV